MTVSNTIRTLSIFIVSMMLSASAVSSAPAEPPDLTVTGPIIGGTRGWAVASTVLDLSKVGYVEREFFVEGKAHGFEAMPQPQAPWGVEPTEDKSFKTRILVRVPVDSSQFNGTVLVEWGQCIHQGDTVPARFVDGNFGWNHDLMLREHFAWVGVASERDCVSGDGADALVHWDGARYGSLSIPDDDMAFDIFTQVAKLVGGKSAERRMILGPLRVKQLVAVGNTQSAQHLATYINVIQPGEKVFSGFFIQDRGASATSLSGAVGKDVVRIREDNAAPVIELNTDPMALRHYAARQPDSKNYRLWEVAGSSHTNFYNMRYQAEATKREEGRDVDICDDAKGNPVPTQYASQAAIWRVVQWAAGGQPAPGFAPDEISGTPPKLQLDRNGNTRGGLVLPEVAVPLGQYTWEGPCLGLGGATIPFPRSQLHAMYPTKEAYLAKFMAAADAAVKAGFLLSKDAEEAVRGAKAANLP